MITRVFLPEINRRFSIDEAEKFGPINYLADGQLNPFQTEIFEEQIRNAFLSKNFNPDNDMLCMTGNTLVTSMTLAIATSLYGKIRLLMFNAKIAKYIVRVWEVQSK